MISMTLPGKVQSYMAAGKPILGAIDGETPKTVEKAQCGLCVPAEDAHALAEAMRQMAADPAQRRAWGENSRSYYLAHFSRQAFLDHLEGMLKEAGK